MMSEAALLDPLVKLISTILVDLKPLFLFFWYTKNGYIWWLNLYCQMVSGQTFSEVMVETLRIGKVMILQRK